MVKRKTQAKRMVRKLKAVRQDLLHRMHAPVREQHRWLGQVLRGHYRYYGVIFNYRAEGARQAKPERPRELGVLQVDPDRLPTA